MMPLAHTTFKGCASTPSSLLTRGVAFSAFPMATPNIPRERNAGGVLRRVYCLLSTPRCPRGIGVFS